MSDNDTREMTPAELELIKGGEKAEKAANSTKGVGGANELTTGTSAVGALYDVFRLRF